MASKSSSSVAYLLVYFIKIEYVCVRVFVCVRVCVFVRLCVCVCFTRCSAACELGCGFYVQYDWGWLSEQYSDLELNHFLCVHHVQEAQTGLASYL